MTFWDNPIVIGLLIGAPSAAIGYLAYIQSKKVDRTSEESGIASGRAEAIAQVIDGLNKIIEALQEDKKTDRADILFLTTQRDTLQKELNRMYRKYGENGT